MTESPSDTRAQIRTAEIDDILGIRDTLHQAIEESDTPYPAPDYPYAMQYVLDQIAMGRVCVAINAWGQVVGVMILDQSHYPWTHPNNPAGHLLSNDHWYVQPKYRRSGVALRMLRWAKAFAKDAGLPLKIQMMTRDAATPLKDRFVANHGMTYCGGNFLFTA